MDLLCPCGVTHEIVVAVLTHEMDASPIDRLERRGIYVRRTGFTQKARIHCKCGRRLEALFTPKDNRR